MEVVLELEVLAFFLTGDLRLWDLLGLTFLTGLMVRDILQEALLDPLQDTDLEA